MLGKQLKTIVHADKVRQAVDGTPFLLTLAKNAGSIFAFAIEHTARAFKNPTTSIVVNKASNAEIEISFESHGNILRDVKAAANIGINLIPGFLIKIPW